MSLNLQRIGQQLKSWRSWKKNTQFLVVLVLLSAVLVTTYAVSNFILYLSRAAAANIFFSPSPLNMPPNSTLSTMIDLADNNIVFASVIIDFDNTKIQLSGEVTPNPAFKNVVKVTSMSEANSTGRIEIALGVATGEPLQTGVVELAKLPLKPVTTQTTSTNITVDLTNSQIVNVVNGQAQNVALTSSPGTINLNSISPTNTPLPTSPPTATAKPTAITPVPTGPTTFTLLPVADSYVSGNWTTINFGGSQTLSVDNSPEIKMTYLKFDLASLSGQNFASAKLRMRTKDIAGSGSTNTQNVKLTDNNWGEYTITYANRPNPGSLVAIINGGQDGTFIEVDVTSAILPKLGQQVSFVLDTTGEDGLEMYSKEYLVSTHKPQLILSTSTGPIPTTPPFPTATGPVQPSDTTLSIIPSTLTVGLNSTFTLDININTGINSVVGTEIYLNFDNQRLSILDIVPGTFFTNPVETLEIIDNNNGQLTYVLHIPPETAAKKGTGKLATMTLRANNVGTALVDFSPGTIVGATNTGNKNALKSTSGSVITIAILTIPGDINKYDSATGICGDGVVNILDYTVLFENFAEAPTDHPCADINKDGRVNILDYVILFENYGRTL